MRRALSLVLFLLFFNLFCGLALADQLGLDQSIQVALEQSPLMLKAKADITAAEGVAGQAAAGFLPQFSLSGSLGKYYSEPQTMEIDLTGTGSASTIAFGTAEEADITSAAASLTQTIFSGGGIRSSLTMAEKGLAIAQQELRRITQELKFDVINAYYGVAKANKFVELSEQSVKMAKTHLARVKALIAAGMSTKADQLRIEVQVARAEMGLTKAKQGLEIAKNNFNNTLGRNLDEQVELGLTENATEEITIYDYQKLLELAYEDRPDWQQYVLAKQVSEAEISLAQSDLWPKLSLVGNYEVGSTNYPSYQSETKTWSAMLSGSWNIFDGTATWNRIKEARAKLAAQGADEISIKRAIALEVKDANFAVQSAKDSLAAARKAWEFAEENHRIAELRYESGVGTNLEVIDAQTALTQSRTDYFQAQFDLQIAQAKVNKVVGSLIY